MSQVDLHTHTTASDGVLSPDELITLAINNNVETLAITDHDTIDGYLSVCQTAQQRGLTLVSGVEVSTTWAGVAVHIVGLNFDPHHSSIKQLLNAQAHARQERAVLILQKLTALGLPITIEEIQHHAQTSHIGRPHIAKLMVEKGYVSNIDKAFKKYLGAGKMGDVKNGWASLVDSINAIRQSGGIAVIAHPNQYKLTRSNLLRMIDTFIGLGGQGIEVISGNQPRDITTKFANLADEKGLFASIGSDFHRQHPHATNVGALGKLPSIAKPIWHYF